MSQRKAVAGRPARPAASTASVPVQEAVDMWARLADAAKKVDAQKKSERCGTLMIVVGEEAATGGSSDGSESFALFVGGRRSGKSTLISRFTLGDSSGQARRGLTT
jgi:hypothetical protein